MNRFILLISTFCLFTTLIKADSFTTSGDGTVYSFAKLSETEGSNVSKTSDGNAFIVNDNVIISENDFFQIDATGIVYFAGDAELIIEGGASLVADEEGVVLKLLNNEDNSRGIEIRNNNAQTKVKNITFDGVGLRNYSEGGLNVESCTFQNHNGSSSGALFLGLDGASFTVKDCSFTNCKKAAIGGAANFFCPITIDNCKFIKNSQANSNIPQLNITAATSVVVKNCVIEGDENLNMVGGIGISNFYGTEGFNIEISNCHIYNNRYGIGTTGVMNVVIKDNVLENNNKETVANNGGSGISLYDPYMKQCAVISGNTITGNLWGITVIGCADVNIGNVEVETEDERYNPGGNIFANNGNNGVLYDLYNNSTNTVYAQGNTWGVDIQDEESIETVIFHKKDNAELGEVIYMPCASDISSISDIKGNKPVDNRIFNLQGQQLKQTQKGLNIIGGRIHVVK